MEVPRPMMLSDVAPELVAWIAAGLAQQGRADLIPAIEVLRIYAAHATASHVSLETITALDARAMMARDDRERISIGRPKGVPARSWSVSIEVIDGRIWHLGLSHPGILRPTFKALAHDLATDGQDARSTRVNP